MTPKISGEALWFLCTDTLLDLIKLFPFLFIVYLIMELFKHGTKEHALKIVSTWGRFCPFAGALAGLLPQCGFSVAAAGLFSEGMVSAGTLAAVFLSTSDEMIPVLISHLTPPEKIVEILAIKLFCATIAGLLLDHLPGFVKTQPTTKPIPPNCRQGTCSCRKRKPLASALYHSVEILFFLALCSLTLNLLFTLAGENFLSSLLKSSAFFGALISCLVALIPNCVSSVIITQLWIEGLLPSGSLIGGLLTASGMGLLVLFRINRPMKENFLILSFVYGIGALCGILLNLLGFSL